MTEMKQITPEWILLQRMKIEEIISKLESESRDEQKQKLSKFIY